MFAIRARRKTVTEKDFLDAVNKVGANAEAPELSLLQCLLAVCGTAALPRVRMLPPAGEDLPACTHVCPHGGLPPARLRGRRRASGAPAARGGRRAPGGAAQVIKGYQKFSATPKYMVYN
jgi:hypothetical protein